MPDPEDTNTPSADQLAALRASVERASAGGLDNSNTSHAEPRKDLSAEERVAALRVSVERASAGGRLVAGATGRADAAGGEVGSVGAGPGDPDTSHAEPRKSTEPRKDTDAEWKKAKDVCFNLLAVRPRTRDELRTALRRKGFDDELCESLLGKLDNAGLVDDAAFAEMWVRSRHNRQGLARRALVAELKRKGVDGAVAAEAAGEIDRDAEEEQARRLVRKKMRSMLSVDEQTATRRLLGMLARKGYPQGLSYAVVRDELRNAGAESTMLDDVTLD